MSATSSKSTARLRARLLSEALEDNVDMIHGRLPRPLRPWRRNVQLWGRRAAFGATVILVSAGVARWLAAAPAGPHPAAHSPSPARIESPRAVAVSDLVAPSVPVPVLDASMLTRPTPPAVLDLTVRRIVIDAGHGGDNRGTSSATGLKEKDLTLDIAGRVQRLLAARGFDTVMTRTSDQTLSLRERAATANGHRGDIFVSIHLNWLERSEDGGIETFYLGPGRERDLEAIAAMENQQSGYSLADMRSLLERIYADARRDESRKLATLVQRSLVGTLSRSEPAVSDRGVKTAPFVVLGATEMPAILAEVSCLSNQKQAEYLKAAEARQRVAEALVSGIQLFARDSRVAVSERTESHGG